MSYDFSTISNKQSGNSFPSIPVLKKTPSYIFAPQCLLPPSQVQNVPLKFSAKSNSISGSISKIKTLPLTKPSKNVQLTLDNVIPFLTHAHKEGSLALKRNCLDLIKTKLHSKILLPLLEQSIEMQLPELTWICFLHALKEGNCFDSLEIKSEKGKILVRALNALIKSPLLKLENEVGHVCFDVTKVDAVSPEELFCLKCLQPLSELMPITLYALDKSHQFKDWLLILEYAPMITHFIASDWAISDDDIEEVKRFKSLKSVGSLLPFLKFPEDLFQHLQQLKPLAPYSLNLTNIAEDELTDEVLMKIDNLAPDLQEFISFSHSNFLHIPFKNLKKINLECSNIAEISSPNLKEFIGMDLANLKKVDLPLIDSIYITKNVSYNNIQKFNAPEAKRIDIIADRLKLLSLPKAEDVVASGKMLVSAQIPSAINAYLCDCPQLKKLEAPKAKLLILENCESITEINAPNAEIVICTDLNDLTKLHAPQAKLILCQNCPDLNDLNLRHVRRALLFDCAALNQLQAPKDAYVIYSSCPSLVLPKEINFTILNKNSSISFNPSEFIGKESRIVHFKHPFSMNDLVKLIWKARNS